MKGITLVGRSGAGKATLTQAMRDRKIAHHKTQYINNYDVIVDMPGEYTRDKTLVGALILYPYGANVVGLLMNAIEDYLLYSPSIVSVATREVIGIVTQTDQPEAKPDLATMWLEPTRCKKVFYISSVTDEEAGDILNYLWEGGGTMPWEREEETDEASSDTGGRLHGGL